jgi:prepilin-type N-terminal cleavage/methylation domain-containing protein
MGRRHAGYGLVELLAAMVVLSVAMGAVVLVFASQGRAYLRGDTQATMEANLRLGMNMITRSLRNGEYGVPMANVSSWITWVPGFTSNPTITSNGPNPAVMSVASATSQPVATLTAHVDAGATTLYVSSSSQLDVGAQRLLLIGDSENALVTGVNSTQVTIDTNPLLAGNPGLARAYPAGTPVYRVDVLTFQVATATSRLLRDDHHGAGAQMAVEDISNLQVLTVTAGKEYILTLTARSPQVDALTGRTLTSSLASRVTLATGVFGG